MKRFDVIPSKSSAYNTITGERYYFYKRYNPSGDLIELDEGEQVINIIDLGVQLTRWLNNNKLSNDHSVGLRFISECLLELPKEG